MTEKNPLMKSRLAIYVIIGVIAPIVLLIVWLSTTDPYSGAFGSPDTQSPTQAFFVIPLLILALISPIVAPLLAFLYFRAIDKRYLLSRKPLSKRETVAFQQARKDSRKNQLIILGLIIIFIIVVRSVLKFYWY